MFLCLKNFFGLLLMFYFTTSNFLAYVISVFSWKNGLICLFYSKPIWTFNWDCHYICLIIWNFITLSFHNVLPKLFYIRCFPTKKFYFIRDSKKSSKLQKTGSIHVIKVLDFKKSPFPVTFFRFLSTVLVILTNT